jgi:hypothetical protein
MYVLCKTLCRHLEQYTKISKEILHQLQYTLLKIAMIEKTRVLLGIGVKETLVTVNIHEYLILNRLIITKQHIPTKL